MKSPLALCSWITVLATAAATTAQPVPNAEFTAGDDAPASWSLNGGQGRWVDRDALEVSGSGSDSSYWRCDGVELEPGRLYRFQFRARRPGGSGTAIAGPAFANRDYHSLSGEWKWYGHVFRVPEETGEGYLRLGQWEATGSIQFDAVRLLPAVPVHRQSGELVLGEGESIRDGLYEFHGTFGHEGSNYHRTLASATADFNSDRWVFHQGSQVTYRFEVPGHQLLSGELAFGVNYHVRGGCTAEASRDGETWQPLVTQEGLGDGRATLPDDLIPAETVYVRLRPSTENSYFQVNRVEFTGRLDGSPPDAEGTTAYATIEQSRPGLEIERITLQEVDTGLARLDLTVANTGANHVKLNVGMTAGPPSGSGGASGQFSGLAAGASTTFPLHLRADKPGEYTVELDVRGSRPDDGFVQASLSYTVPDYYRADYGERIPSVPDSVEVWWCDATHKVPRSRPTPAATGDAARMSAARNDYEAVQIVVKPDRIAALPSDRVEGLTATASPLAGPDGATIPAENIRIHRVWHHFVHHPTDATGIRDWWPDALPPLDEPIDVQPGTNQPMWVLVYVPGDAKPGDYTGTVYLESPHWSADVPLRLHVWDFTLPERNHVETAFGLSAGNIFRYHGLKTKEDKRRVLDMYLQSFAEHRISPYDPVPLDGIGVKFLPEADPPAAEVDFSAFDPAFARAVEKFHFTGFRLPIQGMGGGTFHARHEPRIGEFTEETPQYQAVFSSYVKQLESHFRERGWLDEAYIYWFDEPAPKDYAFVRRGFERLKKYAPGLRTMLTEEPVDELAGPVDIWCPVSFNYDNEAAERRRARGDRFWWYVCTGPKAPYCTLFIDHPATELRVWLWQTWQRDIRGVLVWQSNYWTSTAAFPDPAHPQDPYEDPMGYVSGYSTPAGTKRYWGNGDGRFVYPPPAASVPGKSGPEPVLQPPASSIRWEMLREGIEDYEYLWMLRELIEKHRDGLSQEDLARYEILLEVPESITADMTTFTTDPAPIYARRAEIAEAIERLSH